MFRSLDEFDEIVVADSEYTTRPGEIQTPICFAYCEVRSGRRGVLFASDLHRLGSAPFPVSRRSLFVAHYASAELATMLALRWPLPPNVIDTFAEYRVLTNADPQPPASLLAAAARFGIPTVTEAAKEAMRLLAMSGKGYSAEELRELGDYCLKDVDAALGVLHGLVSTGLDVPRALVRGQFMLAAARTEHVGLPVDRSAAERITSNKALIERVLIEKLDTPGLFEGTHLRQHRIGDFARSRRIVWPRTPSGRFVTERGAIATLAEQEPELAPAVEILDLLSNLRQVEIPVGADGRARTGLRPFRTKTGRGAPSAREFLLAQAGWRRGLVRPPAGSALAYLDFEQQEFAIAAALAGDEAMWADYVAGDPYMALAIRMGQAPSGATKETHPAIRSTFKALILGLQYSMSAYGLARRLGVGIGAAERYLGLHRVAYSKFWAWNDALVFRAQDRGSIRTSFGWMFRPSARTSPRTLRNWPMQGHGADILRVACILGWERGVTICAPLHDAVLIEAAEADIDHVVEVMRGAMIAAGIAVIGRPLRVSHEIIRRDSVWVPRSARPTWDRVLAALDAEATP